MKISQDVRMYAANLGMTDNQAMQLGMENQAVEFIEEGAAT